MEFSPHLTRLADFSPLPGEKLSDLVELLCHAPTLQPVAEPSFDGVGDFSAHYQKQVLPLVQNFEQRRVEQLGKLRNTVTFGLLTLIILIPAQIVLHLSLGASDKQETIGMFALMFYAMMLIWMWHPIRAYKSAVKQEVFPHIFSFFGPEFIYSERGKLPVETLMPSGIIPPHDFAVTNDYVQGKYKGVALETQELNLKEERSSGKTRHVVTVFQGAFIRLGMNKRFHGHTVVKEDKGAVANWFAEKLTHRKLERVVLEDPGFEAKFEIYSSDQIEARYLLTPAFMERLQALSQLFSDLGVQAAFYEDHLLLLIPMSQSRFEVSSLFRPATFEGDIQTILAEMEQIFGIIDLLKLYEQTRL